MPSKDKEARIKRPLRVLITAGPTREFIDPVRFISNLSTGFFGYEIAKAALKKGHRVILVSGPTYLKPPGGVKFISVLTALQMKYAVERFYPHIDCLIMSAAVSDYRSVKFSTNKIKKTGAHLTIKLKENPDILSFFGKKKGDKILVGFALETEDLMENAKEKLKKKNLDFIVAARIRGRDNPFGNKKMHLFIIDRGGEMEECFSPKEVLAGIIVDKITEKWY